MYGEKQVMVKFRAWDEPDGYHNDIGHMSYYNERDVIGDVTNIMEYMGEKDSNGVEICEDDVVHISKNKFGEGKNEVWTVERDFDNNFIVFNQINSVRNIDFNENGELIVEVCPGYYFKPEVLGNIHENPELLY